VSDCYLTSVQLVDNVM